MNHLVPCPESDRTAHRERCGEQLAARTWQALAGLRGLRAQQIAGSNNGIGGGAVAVYGAPADGGFGTGAASSGTAGGGQPGPIFGAPP